MGQLILTSNITSSANIATINPSAWSSLLFPRHTSAILPSVNSLILQDSWTLSLSVCLPVCQPIEHTHHCLVLTTAVYFPATLISNDKSLLLKATKQNIVSLIKIGYHKKQGQQATPKSRVRDMDNLARHPSKGNIYVSKKVKMEKKYEW